MTAAPDGSPVELYALLPELGEGEAVARAVPAGGTVLELGCGTGRITRQLVRLGYRVTAVDESPEMLARVEGAETVCARIEGLDLGRRFDAALLASNLVTAEPETRRSFLEACRRHADLVVVEGLPLGWEPREAESRLGEVVVRLRVERLEGGLVHGAMEYAARGQSWEHRFAMRVFADEAELRAALAESGLRLGERLDERWFTAVA
ncbi:MAG TPA: methyltransferase domain-containing protein [Gaiellaceae bacterium]|nr:methyltransferase domain-containing protein [Gaiellaceae bacterium]